LRLAIQLVEGIPVSPWLAGAGLWATRAGEWRELERGQFCWRQRGKRRRDPSQREEENEFTLKWDIGSRDLIIEKGVWKYKHISLLLSYRTSQRRINSHKGKKAGRLGVCLCQILMRSELRKMTIQTYLIYISSANPPRYINWLTT